MSLLSDLYGKVVNLISRINQIEDNAKSNDELPTQAELVLSSKIRVSNGGESEIILVQDIILKAIEATQPYLNRFIETTGIDSIGLGITINPNWVWMINGIRYTNLSEKTFLNYYSETGFERIDIIVALENNDFQLIHGEEAEIGVDTPAAPTLPINALLVTTIIVGDDTMDSPTLPESGYDFLISTDADNTIVLGADGKLYSAGGVGGSTPDATTTVKGKAQLATSIEGIAGANNTKIVTPLVLKAVTDSLLDTDGAFLNALNDYQQAAQDFTDAEITALKDGVGSDGDTLKKLNDKFADKENSSNKGAPNGYAPLNSSTKIDTTYLPDSILGQLLYGGVVDASTAIATLTNNAKSKLGTASATITLTNDTTAINGYVTNEGIYYIATLAGTFAGVSFEVGDWLVSIGSAWKKIDNTDAISSFNSRTGAIVLLNSDISEIIEAATSATPDDTDSLPILQGSVLKKLTFTNLKAFLKTYFDTLYASVANLTLSGLTTLNGTTQTGSGAIGTLDINQTWNTTGVPTAVSVNITNTASGALAKLLDLKVGGSSQFVVDKSGLATANNLTSVQNVEAGGAFQFRFLNRSIIVSPSNGVLRLANAAGTDFSRLQFGLTTNLAPSLKRNSASLEVRLADDSGFTSFQSLYQRFGSGTPEGVVTAPIGAFYSRTDGGAGTSFYVKESGVGNTGWVAK